MFNEELPAVDLGTWQRFTRNHVAIGGCIDWEYASRVVAHGLLGDQLELQPLAILRRFANTEDVFLGCQMIQRDSRHLTESMCQLSCDDLRFLLCRPDSQDTSCCEGERIVSVSTTLTTRNGFQIRCQGDSSERIYFVSAASRRMMTVSPQEFLRLRQSWLECLQEWSKFSI